MDRMTELQKFSELAAKYWWLKYQGIFPKLNTKVPTIKISKRMKTTAGNCKVAERVVTLCFDLLDMYPDEFKKDTIPHELAHQVAYDIFGVGKSEGKQDWHGKDWQKIMNLAGLDAGRCHSMVNHRYKR